MRSSHLDLYSLKLESVSERLGLVPEAEQDSESSLTMELPELDIFR